MFVNKANGQRGRKGTGRKENKTETGREEDKTLGSDDEAERHAVSEDKVDRKTDCKKK